ILRAIFTASASASMSPTPMRIVMPCPILPTTSPPTRTSLRRTRWISARIASPFCCKSTHKGDRIGGHTLAGSGKTHALRGLPFDIDRIDVEAEGVRNAHPDRGGVRADLRCLAHDRCVHIHRAPTGL